MLCSCHDFYYQLALIIDLPSLHFLKLQKRQCFPLRLHKEVEFAFSPIKFVIIKWKEVINFRIELRALLYNMLGSSSSFFYFHWRFLRLLLILALHAGRGGWTKVNDTILDIMKRRRKKALSRVLGLGRTKFFSLSSNRGRKSIPLNRNWFSFFLIPWILVLQLMNIMSTMTGFVNVKMTFYKNKKMFHDTNSLH